MNIAKRSLSALGKLFAAGLLVLAFSGGLAAVVYFSLSGKEVSVPDITGKDFFESEKELVSLGLKIKKRAERVSNSKMNTVLEQLPKPGETVKTGQMILVVVSKAPAPGDEPPPSLKKDINDDDTKKIEEMISDKPKKAKPPANSNSNSNSNTRKADTARDVSTNGNVASGPANLSVPANVETKKSSQDEKLRNNTEKNTDKNGKNDKKERRDSPAVKPAASPAMRQPARNN